MHKVYKDLITAAIKKQGQFAVIKHREDSKIRCKYRMEVDGKELRCLVGILLPDEVYDEEVDNATGAGSSFFRNFFINKNRNSLPAYSEWLESLGTTEKELARYQRLHDDIAKVVCQGYISFNAGVDALQFHMRWT